MPRIFDNIDLDLVPALRRTLEKSERADFSVGYFNLRGWKQIDDCIEGWSGGPGHCCRLLVGMQRQPQEEIETALRLTGADDQVDLATVRRRKNALAQEFSYQLTIGAPTNQDEAALRRLAAQIRSKKVIVKLFLRHTLHAKLYLLFGPDVDTPRVDYLGSSNLTLAGLAKQGELNIDVLDQDATAKLARWFEDRWNDHFCVDISDELVQIIDESWAREQLVSPYHIYIKMAYHLSQDARAGIEQFTIPADFGQQLFEFQTAAVKIAAHHLNRRGGVLIGDVVGLGKTLMATALARIFEDDQGLETLILCPKNLVKMWDDYRVRYRLRATVLSTSRAIHDLPTLRRHRLVLIDESHNLRNREGKTYRAIQDYIDTNDSKCILLTATPYNKTYLDLSNQLRLFVPEDQDLGIRPEALLRDVGEVEFTRRHQAPPHSLAAFEQSNHPDDWRELMRLYLVRRTRSFIKDNYAQTDPVTHRKYLTYEDGQRSYFPDRVPRTVKFPLRDTDPQDAYARLYDHAVVDAVNDLTLPRYGLGNYAATKPQRPPTPAESKLLEDLGKAGKRLMGFCRTNLFKRLESGGLAFIQSVERHILRNYIYLYAIEKNLPLPIGTQDAEYFDSGYYDEDPDDVGSADESTDTEETYLSVPVTLDLHSETTFKARAAKVYEEYDASHRSRFKWLSPQLFSPALREDLHADAQSLLGVLKSAGTWDPSRDGKLNALHKILTREHSCEKVIVFTQFADTARYLEEQLAARGLKRLAKASGDSADPTSLAWRFSPISNNRPELSGTDAELRVLIATDVLSEGQNLQDAAIVVNYDLPWAIIRLIQRAGRVDRIGQQAPEILCYSFLPAEGVERIIKLRGKVRRRLQENAEVVGADEAFFEGDRPDTILNLYNEKAGILDGAVEDASTEVDLASYAYQIWQNAIKQDPGLEKTITSMPPVVFATKPHHATKSEPDGVLIYLRTGDGNDALAWVDRDCNSVSESQFAILRAAACTPDTPSLPRQENHHRLVAEGARQILDLDQVPGGQLGRPSGARFKTYERLKQFIAQNEGTLFVTDPLKRAIDEIYRYPLRQSATDTLNRQLRSGISDYDLVRLVQDLSTDDRLCIIQETERREAQIICSMGLSAC